MVMVTDDDFFTSLFSGLAELDCRVFSLQGPCFNKAVLAAFTLLQEQKSVNLRFNISLQPVYEDSGTISGALARAIQRNIAVIGDHNTVHVNIAVDAAPLYFPRLPLSEELILAIANEFVRVYDQEMEKFLDYLEHQEQVDSYLLDRWSEVLRRLA